jgi:hypothetical protein
MATRFRSKVFALVCSHAGLMLAMGSAGLVSCSGGGHGDGKGPAAEETAVPIETGSVQLALTARGNSGALYRLRNATFQVEEIDDSFPPPPPPLEPFPGPISVERVAGTPGRAGSPGNDVPAGGGTSSGGSPGSGGSGGAPSTGGSTAMGGFAGTGVAGTAGAAGAAGGGGSGSGFLTFLSTENDPFATTLETTLPIGLYRITLLDGWQLERVLGSEVSLVEATLDGSPSQDFFVSVNEETFVVYRFQTDGGNVVFGDGRLIVDIEVDETPGGGNGDDPRLTVMENAREALPFTLEETLGMALANAGSTLDAESAYHGIIDSYANAATGRDPGLAHCDDEQTDGAPSLNGFPLQCGRLEGEQFDNLGAWVPLAAVNRLDLTPADGANCGQQRLIFANNSPIGNSRMFIIVENVVPNPSPECGVAACTPIAAFWTNLSAIGDPVERGIRLREAFLTGSPELASAGFAPFVNARNLGPEGGQIRTNNFNDSPWTLREFHFGDVDQPPLPEPVAESPNGALWNDAVALPQGEACRASFLRAAALGLATNDLSAMSFPVDEACKDAESRADSSEDYPFQLSLGTGDFRERLAEVGAPLGVTAEELAARARFAGSCMGCHIEAGGSSLGNGVSAPFQFDFVHVSEFGAEPCGNGGTCFGISEALRSAFLPARARITRDLANSPSCAGGPVEPVPVEGDGGAGPIDDDVPFPLGATAPARQGVRFTLGGQVVDDHAH